MAHNSISPGFVKIQYEFSSLTHYMTLPVVPEQVYEVGSLPSFLPRSGAAIPMNTAVAALQAVLLPFVGNGTEFIQAEYWQKPGVDDDPQWVYTHAMGVPGSSGTASVNSLQNVITFRTSNSGIYKMYLMEVTGAIVANTRNTWPFGAGSNTNMANYLIGTTGWVVGRDGGYPVVPMYATSKTNDALRKKRLGI